MIGQPILYTVLPADSVIDATDGNAEEILPEERDLALSAHLKRHPDLASFLSSDDCALIVVTVEAYQVVQGIDDVRWLTVGKLDESWYTV